MDRQIATWIYTWRESINLVICLFHSVVNSLKCRDVSYSSLYLLVMAQQYLAKESDRHNKTVLEILAKVKCT